MVRAASAAALVALLGLAAAVAPATADDSTGVHVAAPDSVRARIATPDTTGARIAAPGSAAARIARRPFEADDGDTIGVRFEVGVSTDVSSEQFYEDAFLDSVALGIKRVDSPEARVAAVWHTSLAGTREERTTSYRFDNELSWGDLVRSELLSLDWRHRAMTGWRWAIAPRGELRRDRTFGRDLEQARAVASAKLARMFPALESMLELAGQGELLRTHGSGADFIPDRNGAGLMLRFGRQPPAGSQWQLGLGATRRAFPDTATRDHIEQRAEASWHHDLAGGHRVDLAAEAARRSTLHAAPTSQDRYREGNLDGTLELSLTSGWTTALRGRFEGLRYDEHDSTGFFDYDLSRVELEPRWADGAWSVHAGPRVEWLSSRDEPGESYAEWGAALEAEWFGAGWWSLGPAYGYRRYRETLASAPAPGSQPVLASRASFAFVQMDLMGDQSLPLRLKLRVFASGRIEQHSDPAQDARSLYISLDVRRLF